MNIIEIIEVRINDDNPFQLEKQIQELIDQLDMIKIKKIIKIYKNTVVENDISFHILHDSVKVEKRGSALGYRLVSVLKSFGLVSHTIWIENEKLYK